MHNLIAGRVKRFDNFGYRKRPDVVQQLPNIPGCMADFCGKHLGCGS